MEEKIIDPVSTELLLAELTPDKLLRETNKGNNLIYVVDAHSAPNTMREIGRLREISFRAAGGGTGKDCDIDEYDTMTPPCRQIIVWDPDSDQILGGYRYITGENIRKNPDGTPRIATSHMFRFSQNFIDNYLPYTIELGRSFVRPEYQSSKAGAKALYALDNLWDGLGALTVVHPEIKYLFGKVTMYPGYIRNCRDMILYFLNRHFPDNEELVRPITPLATNYDEKAMEQLFTGATFAEDYKILNKAIRNYGVNIPPLVNAYMSLSPTMKMFGTAINDTFGDVEESGIFFAIDEIFEEKKRRHIGTYHHD
ncbi:MAG: GNAT family N-acetyltransferase [Paramuribaculum sp.]|nr:GNAT family N-acetyltransferase [Barnesiella sp.]MDE5821492.1 GNAT family N-acetyltransferase [Paramuribaculum sp.]MDE5835815.1 GNAT family N-acetyltransferase [Paramuribaculum sp.]